jgi:hypothetical protein
MLLPRVSRLGRLVGATGTSCGKEALRAGAEVYLNFISLTRNLVQSDNNPVIAHNRALSAAAKRYRTFNQLRIDNSITLVPTRDISLLWAADMLRPGSYSHEHEEATEVYLSNEEVPPWYFHQQCRLLQSGATFETATTTQWDIGKGVRQGIICGLIGGVIFKHPVAAGIGAVAGVAMGSTSEVSGAKVTPAVAMFDKDGSGVISTEEREAALAPWVQAYEDTEVCRHWRLQNPTTSNRSLHGSLSSFSIHRVFPKTHTRTPHPLHPAPFAMCPFISSTPLLPIHPTPPLFRNCGRRQWILEEVSKKRSTVCKESRTWCSSTPAPAAHVQRCIAWCKP